MEILTVFRHHQLKGNPDEKCLWSTAGHYVGLKSGTHYSAEEYYHRPQLRAIVRQPDEENQTGMYHLDTHWQDEGKKDENRATWKRQFVGCLVTVETTHRMGDLNIYHCLELNECFSANELQIISPDNPK